VIRSGAGGKRASFAEPYKPKLRLESPVSPIITAGQEVVFGKSGVLFKGFAWHEWFPRTHVKVKSETIRLLQTEKIS